MNLFLEEKRLSVKCHRHKHEQCRNKSKLCGCSCHRVIELNEEKRLSDIQVLDDYICKQWVWFWRPFR